ncbi:MAG: hypothetical protein R2848_10390 [Thermomicrobiales bacterium]
MIDDALFGRQSPPAFSYLDQKRWYADEASTDRRFPAGRCCLVGRQGVQILLSLIGIDYQVGESRRISSP